MLKISPAGSHQDSSSILILQLQFVTFPTVTYPFWTRLLIPSSLKVTTTAESVTLSERPIPALLDGEIMIGEPIPTHP